MIPATSRIYRTICSFPGKELSIGLEDLHVWIKHGFCSEIAFDLMEGIGECHQLRHGKEPHVSSPQSHEIL